MNKVAVICQGGLGDNIIYAARLKSLLNKYQADKADFYLVIRNIYPAVLDMIIDFLEAQDTVDSVFYYNNIEGSGYKAVVDWTADNAPREYPIEPKWKAQYDSTKEYWADLILGKAGDNPITFYPYTMGSNPNNEHEKYIRSPKEDWWLGLFEAVKKAGGSPIVLGGPNERIGWNSHNVVEAYSDIDDWMHNIPLLYKIKAHIGIASWPWQLTHYAGEVDTCVIWTNNNFWIDRSVSEDQSKLHIFQTVPTYEEIISKIGVLK
jgi:hypothetical protein